MKTCQRRNRRQRKRKKAREKRKIDMENLKKTSHPVTIQEITSDA
jgi:hypothetical protein